MPKRSPDSSRSDLSFFTPGTVAHAQSDATLHTSEARYQTLITSIDQGFCILEMLTDEGGEPQDFRYLEANPACVAQSGFSSLVGKTLRQVLSDTFEQQFLIYRSVLETAVPSRFESGSVAQGRVLEHYAFRIQDTTQQCVGVSSTDITERKRAENSLRRSEAKLRDFVENASIGLQWVGSDGIVLWANQTELDLLGYAREEYIGHHITEFHADQPVIEDMLVRLTGGETLVDHASRLRCKDGSIRHVLTNSNSYFENDKFIHTRCFTRDNTERKRAEAALRESEAFTRSIIESSPDCIKVLDLEGNLLSMQSGQALLGIDDIQPFLNTSWLAFWSGEYRLAAEVAVASAAAGDSGRFVGFLRTLRGIPKWWDVAISPIFDARGKPATLLAVSRDVTLSKQAELNLAFLASVSRDLVHWSNMDEMMRSIGAKMAAHFQLSVCALAEINDSAEQVVINHEWHREDVPSLIGVYRLADFVEEAFIQEARAGEIIVVRNAASDARTDPRKFATLNIASFVCVPLIQDGQWRFALCLYHAHAYDWREDEIELARELTARIWTRLERLRAEAALRDSEERYRTLFNSMDQGYSLIELIFDAQQNPVDYRFLETNPAFEKQSGIRNVIGKRVRELYPDLEQYWFDAYGKVALTGEAIRFINQAESINGIWFDLYAFRMGGPDSRKVAVLFTNITDSKNAQIELNHSMKELRAAETGLHATQLKLLQEKRALDDNVLQLQDVNGQLVAAMLTAQTQAEAIEQARAQLVHMAQHDALTGLPNRILLNDRLAQAMALAQRQGKQLALMFLDLDHFKYINDSLGHGVGDQLLLSVAQRLTGAVRASDTVCRQGGDEFVVLLADVEHPEDAALSAEKILAALTTPHPVDGHELHVTVSIGISIYPDDAVNADTLIKNADTAMYHAKENGRNSFQFFKTRMNVLAVERYAIENELRSALARNELLLFYQPIINLDSGRIAGVEALLRWQHPLHGLILPEQFIWIAEDSGLIVPIGGWVLQEACRLAQSWQDAGLPPLSVAVNVSAVQFRHPDFLKQLSDILDDTGLAPHCLELELTEGVLMQDSNTTIAILDGLKVLGVRLAIDDFGTGNSSLSYLKRFNIDTLKIDQSFLRDINHAEADSADASIISAVVGLGKNLKLRVIVEGVETPVQLAFLQAYGGIEGQGFYISSALAADKLLELLQTGQ